MSRLPDFDRLLALALLNYSDDKGFFWANPLLIRGSLFPFDEESGRITRSLAHLAQEGYLRLGKTQDGREVGHIIHFLDHQKIEKPKESCIKPLATFGDVSTTIPLLLPDESPLDRNREQGTGNGSFAPAPPPPTKPKTAKKPREKNPLFDEIARVTQTNPEISGGEIGKALAAIKSIDPDVTADEIARRFENCKTYMTDCTPGPMALAKWWPKCIGAKVKDSPITPLMR